eukprot:CAMPEP_0172719378 /NCGR_PEP_ID=MMETSP1074-20121228/75471_1 /TAXON_ID=2916 /ORGANISM="Ceratium fusus, Strain PA161109" /LENGTH=275 /DNA_ID=CAMNT_0013544725 /DNA_START=27 /DNA_END=854 /DNA_ORIENTATION=+
MAFRVVALLSLVGLVVASPTVLVTGATGRTGALLYSMLKAKGVNVRALVRNATKAKEVLKCSSCDQSEGIYVGDVTESESLTAAMTGVTALAIATGSAPHCKDFKDPSSCSYPKGAYPIDIDFHGTELQIETFAKVAKGGPVVLCSSMGTTDPDHFLNKLGNGNILFFKLNAEAFLMSSGLPFTIIKPCGLSDGNAAQRELHVGHDDQMHETPPQIPRADVARVMAEALLQPKLAENLRFDLCSQSGTPTEDVSALFDAARFPWQHPVQSPMLLV